VSLRRQLDQPWLLGLVGIFSLLLLWQAGGSFAGSSIRSFCPARPEVLGCRSGAGSRGDLGQTMPWRALAACWGAMPSRSWSRCRSALRWAATGLVCQLLEPLLGLIRYMPAPAFIPLLIIYFGLGELPKVLADSSAPSSSTP